MMKKSINKKAWPWLWLSVLVVVLDQITKYFAASHLTFGIPYTVFPFFNLTLNFNPGAAFRFLGDASGWQIYLFAVVSLLVVLFLIVWLARIKCSDVLMAMGMCLIIGGALGNMIDRVRLHYVIDFFDFYLNSWHFATFNVADSAVCVGAFLIIVRILVTSKKITSN